MSIPKSVFVNICRALLAITFIFSGFVKAIDPMGTQYKLDDYVKAVGMAGIIPEWILLMLSVILSALEFTLGVLMAGCCQPDSGLWMFRLRNASH